jgi:hypothetical protein
MRLFEELIIFFQISFSASSLVFLATFPYLFQAVCTSLNQDLSSTFIISVVVASASIHITSSKLLMLSFRDSFLSHLKSLYSLVVISDRSFRISFVKIAYSIHSFIHLLSHSQVNSFLISIDLSL